MSLLQQRPKLSICTLCKRHVRTPTLQATPTSAVFGNIQRHSGLSEQVYSTSAEAQTATSASAACDEQTCEAWEAFSIAAAGEWDGVCVTFNGLGEAQELPHSFVPDAFREWGISLRSWQTQCSSSCQADTLLLKTRRLFPTVGCEADAIAFEQTTDAASWALPAGLDTAFLPLFMADGSYARAPRSLGPGAKLEVALMHPQPNTPSAGSMRQTASLNIQPGTMQETGQADADASLQAAAVATGRASKATRSRTRFVIALSQADKEDGGAGGWALRTLEVHEERFDRPWDGRTELGGCGGGMPCFADRPQLAAASLQADGWTPRTVVSRVLDPAGPSIASQESCWSLRDLGAQAGASNIKLLLLPDKYCCAVKNDAALGFWVLVGVWVAGSRVWASLHYRDTVLVHAQLSVEDEQTAVAA